MSPRKNRARRDEPPGRPDGTAGGVERLEDGWVVRQVAGQDKTYRCPGCDQEVRPGTPHVVAWRDGAGLAGDGPDARRHWHTACWNARGRRAPTVRRPGRPPRI